MSIAVMTVTNATREASVKAASATCARVVPTAPRVAVTSPNKLYIR